MRIGRQMLTPIFRSVARLPVIGSLLYGPLLRGGLLPLPIGVRILTVQPSRAFANANVEIDYRIVNFTNVAMVVHIGWATDGGAGATRDRATVPPNGEFNGKTWLSWNTAGQHTVTVEASAPTGGFTISQNPWHGLRTDPVYGPAVSDSTDVFVDANVDLTGYWSADDGGTYYVWQDNETIWWAGLSDDSGLQGGLTFCNVFKGQIVASGATPGNHTIVGEWADVPRGVTMNSGTLSMAVVTISQPFVGAFYQLSKQNETGGFSGSVWKQVAVALDRRNIADEFTRVAKNQEDESLRDNLTPFKDHVVIYGTLANDSDGGIMHVGFPPDHDRSTYQDFICLYDTDNPPDGDINFNMTVDRSQLARTKDFWTTGWESEILPFFPNIQVPLDPDVVRQKFDFRNRQYLHCELIMFGGTAHCGNARHYNDPRLLPGWQDSGGNSVLLNGRPIAGNLQIGSDSHVDSILGMPTFDCQKETLYLQSIQEQEAVAAKQAIDQGGGPDAVYAAYAQATADAEKRLQDCMAQPPPTNAIHDGSRVRVTGVLVLDCGHFRWDDPDDKCGWDDNDYQNQEIHPVYAIDIITATGRDDLTGAWGDDDGNTYYLRQLGDTIWWLGMGPFRDQSFAQVFHGTIRRRDHLDTYISGDWRDVPLGWSTGGGSVTVNVDQTLINLSADTEGPWAGKRWQKLYDVFEDAPVT